MNLHDTPSKAEVMGWSSDHLADYLKRMRLFGCDTVVKRSCMNGAQFLTMSSSDLQKFPNVHVPLITKICSDINKSGKKKGIFHRPKPPQHPHQDFPKKHEAWDPEEFDNDSDPDYEEPDANEDNYICAVPENFEEGEDEYDYEIPPGETPNEIPSHFRSAKSQDNSDYIDNRRSCPTKRQTRPPQEPDSTFSHSSRSPARITATTPARHDFSPHRPITSINRLKPAAMRPHIDRTTKPRMSGVSKTSHNISERKLHPINTMDTLQSASHPPQPSTGGVPSSKLESAFPLSDQQNLMFQNSQMAQDMDPQWYVGQMTRVEAEATLRQMSKDGAFLIRDSSKNFTDQPYTLMVLNKQKVYNVQIRFLGNMDGYSLGTGLSGIESFPSVRDIVTCYTKTPLMLIDAMERGTGVQHQCCLMHPARR